MGDTTKTDLTVDSVDISSDGRGNQTVTLVLSYSGATDLAGKIVQGQQLSVELPTHKPPA